MTRPPSVPHPPGDASAAPAARVRTSVAPRSVPPVRRASGAIPESGDWAAGSNPRIPAHRPAESSGPILAGPPVPRRIGNYEITGFLGSGGMADVYIGVHPVLGRRAAIKLLRRELLGDHGLRQRFLQEARITDHLRHQNIVDILDVGQTLDGRLYLVMELLEGRTLAHRVEEGRLPPLEAIEVLLQLCAGLSAAHQAGVIHRDLKPDNIFLAQTEAGLCVKILDWGVARATQGADARGSAPDMLTPRLTSDGLVVGTPLYIAPEQARGLPADARSDVYALGVVAYEMLLGAPPFTGGTAVDLMYRHLRETPTAPSTIWPEIPPALEALLFGLLAKIPELRPSLDDLCEVLDAVRSELREVEPAVEAIPTPIAAEPVRTSARASAAGADGRDTWVQIQLASDSDDFDLLLVAPVARLSELGMALAANMNAPEVPPPSLRGLDGFDTVDATVLDGILDELSAEVELPATA
jgi:serine/threonine protein kinase